MLWNSHVAMSDPNADPSHLLNDTHAHSQNPNPAHDYTHKHTATMCVTMIVPRAYLHSAYLNLPLDE